MSRLLLTLFAATAVLAVSMPMALMRRCSTSQRAASGSNPGK